MHIQSLVISILVILFGFYILNVNPKQTTQKYFFFLCLALGIWSAIFAIRGILPYENRNFALNLTVVPSVFAPYLFYRVVGLISGKGDPPRIFKTFNFLIIFYFVLCGLTENFGRLTDPESFKATGFLNYHLVNTYCAVFLGWSIIILAKSSLKSSGMRKFQSVLLLAGSVLASFGVPPKKRTWSCSNFFSELDGTKIT